ncbi:unnamed protein product [Caenorhabditis angaria]|uniref:Fcf2 pre-rRNA processing C-terminal domain-containing protein n=1 Tax=Caenorhabditis angaria TaxID=860376 RepID=A0A9P1IBE7_9PELO|nr:unnamed protein product [Caenorhabditis angaria]
MSSLYYKKLRKQQNNESSSSEDSDSDVEVPTKKIKVTQPRVEDVSVGADDLFVIDRDADEGAKGTSEILPQDLLGNSHLQPYEMDKDLKKLLEKAITGPKFEANHQPQVRLMGTNAQARLRKTEREKTKGDQWFNMPATELTEENKRDLEMLQMRNVLDPLAHYKRNDRGVLPKYFQVGKVVDAPEDYYSSRMLKKERKKTMVDELLYNEESLVKTKKKYTEIKQAEQKKRRGAFQKFGYKKSHKQQREGKKK